MGHQLANMAMLYVLIGLLNKRARTAGNNAARQVGADLAAAGLRACFQQGRFCIRGAFRQGCFQQRR
jgi:hypothetical protein